MSDDVIPLNEIGKKGTVKVYNQAYVDKQQKRIEELEAKYYSVSEIAYHRGMCCISALRENRELEKENAELKDEIHTWKEASSTNSYKAFQLQEENKTLSKHIVELQNDKGELVDRCRELEQQIEKLIDFVLSKIECCDVCPLTDTCINSEGTCPYAGILSKGEEAVTREWLMQKIVKEIKRK